MRTRSPLALWHLLSLDAPTIATLWTWFVARSSGVELQWISFASVFVAVWMLYVADRLLDARLLDKKSHGTEPVIPETFSQLEERHRFHHCHRGAFRRLLILSAFLLAMMLPALPADALRLYVVLAALLFGWFLLVHTRLSVARRLPKELAVGLFFPAAVFIPTVALRPELRLALLLPAALFAGVCALNCLYLYAWEHPGKTGQAHWTTRIATQHLNVCALMMTTLCVLFISPHMSPAFASVFASSLRPTTQPGLLAAACAASTVCLLLLHQSRGRFSAIHLRTAADLALLTPILFAPFLHRLP